MRTWKAVAILAVAGCAGAPPVRYSNSPLGHWDGQVDQAGLSQTIAVDIVNEKGGYSGQWQPGIDLPKRPLENVEVQGDAVRFEIDRLRFVGHVADSKLAGTVTDKAANAPAGAFLLRPPSPPAPSWNPFPIGP